MTNSPGWIWTIWQHLAPFWWPITSSSVPLSSLRSLGFHIRQSSPSPPRTPLIFTLMFHVGLRHRETIHHQFTAITTRPPVGHLSEPGDRFPSILPKWQLYSLRPGLSFSRPMGRGRAPACTRGRNKGIHLADKWRCCPKGCWLCSWWIRSLIKSFVQPSVLLLNVRLSLQPGQDVANYWADTGLSRVLLEFLTQICITKVCIDGTKRC